MAALWAVADIFTGIVAPGGGVDNSYDHAADDHMMHTEKYCYHPLCYRVNPLCTSLNPLHTSLSSIVHLVCTAHYNRLFKLLFTRNSLFNTNLSASLNNPIVYPQTDCSTAEVYS